MYNDVFLIFYMADFELLYQIDPTVFFCKEEIALLTVLNLFIDQFKKISIYNLITELTLFL